MGRRRRNLTTGQKVIDWIGEWCRVPEGKDIGQKVVLRPWQKRVVRGIYDVPKRRAIITFGRKNGKTSLAAFLLLAHLCGPVHRPNSQLFSAAQSRDQAAILFGLAAKIVRMSAGLAAVVAIRDTAKQLFCQELGTLYRALSAEATTAYGLSPVFVVHDELGQVRGPRSELYDALETAQGAHENPLSIIISTQAPTDADLLSILIDDAMTREDPSTAVFIFAADTEDDPWSEKTWKKANPALGDFRSMVDMKDLSDKAKRMPSFESAFRNLNLNQRVAAANHFLSREVWLANAEAPDLDLFEHCEVFAGLDLSARQDMTAWCEVAREEPGGPVHIDMTYFAPEEGLLERARRDRQPYDLWRDQGFLVATPGRTVDYAWVAEFIAERAASRNIVQIRYDRWRIDILKDELNRVGVRNLPLVPMGQGYKDMSPALDELEAHALAGNLRHGRNPILTWNAANAIVTRDAAGNRKLDKSKASGRIDGMVALAMAVASMVGVVVEKPSYQMWVFDGNRANA